MSYVLESGAGEVETPAMAAEARRETRLGAEGDEEGDGGDGVQDSERVRLGLNATQHNKLTEPQGFMHIIHPPLLTPNNVFE